MQRADGDQLEDEETQSQQWCGPIEPITLSNSFFVLLWKRPIQTFNMVSPARDIS